MLSVFFFLPLFFGQIFSGDFSSFFPDVRGSVRVFQLVHVHVEGHGVGRREVFAEAGGEALRILHKSKKISTFLVSLMVILTHIVSINPVVLSHKG